MGVTLTLSRVKRDGGAGGAGGVEDGWADGISSTSAMISIFIRCLPSMTLLLNFARATDASPGREKVTIAIPFDFA